MATMVADTTHQGFQGDVNDAELGALLRRGVKLVTPKMAATALSRCEKFLRIYSKRRPDRLTALPGGGRGVLYRMDQIEEIAKTGFV